MTVTILEFADAQHDTTGQADSSVFLGYLETDRVGAPIQVAAPATIALGGTDVQLLPNTRRALLTNTGGAPVHVAVRPPGFITSRVATVNHYTLAPGGSAFFAIPPNSPIPPNPANPPNITLGVPFQGVLGTVNTGGGLGGFINLSL